MKLDQNTLEMQFGHTDHGLSARRLWEHTELGQVNVFSRAISGRQELNDAAAFIDIVRLEGDSFTLVGLTLAELRAGRIPASSSLHGDTVLPGLVESMTAPPLFVLSQIILTYVRSGRPCATSTINFYRQHMRMMCLGFRSYSARCSGYCGAWPRQRPEPSNGVKRLRIFTRRACGLRNSTDRT